MMPDTAYLIFPCASITSIGDIVFMSAAPHPRRDAAVKEGGGGMVRGEELENGTNDIRLGNNGYDGMRFSCWRMAKRRKCRVR